jgi:release factor glutamine methyltransferase
VHRKLYQLFGLPLYRRWALRHIREERHFTFQGLRLKVPPGVFHPGIFFSSPIFVGFLQQFDFQAKKVLDIGTGSGLLALVAAKKGAMVTALDILPQAVATALENARSNGLPLQALESDLLDQLPPQPFDFILINPPYYPKKPQNLREHAFFAGENLEYFEKLFAQLPAYLNPRNAPEPSPNDTRIWLVLSEDCALDRISEIAARNGFLLQSVFEQRKWGERFLILQADPTQL